MIPQFLLRLLFTQCILAQTAPDIAVQTDCDWIRIVYKKMRVNSRSIPEDCCIMYGVTCTDGMVTSVDWKSHDLAGSIPEELRNLVNLHKL
jgi:hypothetical protein